MAGAECMHCICKKEKRNMRELLIHVARIISSDWKCLGRELGVEEPAIKAIEADYHTTYEQAYQVLQKWFEANGETVATRSALCKALHAIKKTYIADIFCGRCRLKRSKRSVGLGRHKAIIFLIVFLI